MIEDNFYSADQKIDHIYDSIGRRGGAEKVVYSNVSGGNYASTCRVNKSNVNEFISKTEEYDKLSHKNTISFA